VGHRPRRDGRAAAGGTDGRLTGRIRLSRDYYVRIDGNDYSVNPRAIGRFVDWIATPAQVAITCAEQIVATHERI